MTWWQRLRRGEQLDRELHAELQDHLARQIADHIAAGMSEEDARRQARLEFGSDTCVKEACRDARGTRAAGDIVQDVRFAVRLLSKERWFALTSIGALALGMGVVTMMITILNGYYGSGLPVADPERVVHIGTRDVNGRPGAVSYPQYREWRDTARSFAALGAFGGVTMTIAEEGQSPDSLGGAYLAAEAFEILEQAPLLGRGLLPDDDRVGAPPVVVLGYRLWMSRYSGDPRIVGRSIHVNGTPATIVGVMPDGFEFPYRHALWQPLALMPGLDAQQDDERVLGVIARLAHGISRAQATAELTAIGATPPRSDAERAGHVQPTMTRFGQQQVGRFGDTLAPLALAATAAFVLLIACANVANLLLARAAGRSREMAIRAAVGATRWRVVRQLLVESLMIAVAAGGVGLWLSTFGVRFVSDAFGRNTPYWMRFAIDDRVLVLVLSVCVVSTLMFGLAPALFASKTDLNGVLKEGPRTAVVPRVRRSTGMLLAAEIALTFVLLATAGLMVRSYLALHEADRPIDTSQVLTLEVALPEKTYPTPDRRADFHRRLDDHLRSLPGVQAATVTSTRPFAGAAARRLSRESHRREGADALPAVSTVAIGPRYFDTLSLPLLQGRAFEDRDGSPGHHAAIVNQRFAHVYYPNESPLGQRIRLEDAGSEAASAPWLTIVGVSPTIRQGHSTSAEPVVYLPLQAYSGRDAAILIGAVSEPARITPLVRHEVATLDADVTVFNVRPLGELLADSRLEPKLMGTLLVVFAGMALLLAIVGLYAATAYAVVQRTHEIGVRMALGARPAQVVWSFVRRGLVPVGAGLAAGLSAAVGAGHVLRSLLIDTSATDPLTLLGTLALLVAAALAACIFPACRAARLDPVGTLRHE